MAARGSEGEDDRGQLIEADALGEMPHEMVNLAPLPSGNPAEEKQPDVVVPMNCVVFFCSIMGALGGFLFGYDVGIISGALLQLQERFNLTDIEEELVVSIMLVGAMLASITGGFIVDYLGRRLAIVCNAVVFVVGAVILSTAQSYGVLLFGRFVVGFAVSLSAIAEVIYISEIAPPASRGLLVSLNEMGITIGILIAYGVNYALIATPNGWRYMFILSCIPAVIQGVGMAFLPQSPRWLVLKDRPVDALQALRRLRGNPTVEAEMALQAEVRGIERNIREQYDTKFSDLIYDPVLRRCLIVACALALLQQFTGQPNVLYYGSTLFKAAGFTTNKEATEANILIGLAKVVATAIALAKIDNLGRRGLLLFGVVIMVLSLVTLATVTAIFPPEGAAANSTSITNLSSSSSTMHPGRRSLDLWTVHDFSYDPCMHATSPSWTSAVPLSGNFFCLPSQPHERCRRDGGTTTVVFKNTAVKWTSMACMVTFVVAYAFSFGPVTWLLLSELFPDNIRGRAMSLATVFNWGGNLVVSLTFLTLLNNIGFSATFFLYAAIGVFAFFFIGLFVPETKHKSLSEVGALMKKTIQLDFAAWYRLLTCRKAPPPVLEKKSKAKELAENINKQELGEAAHMPTLSPPDASVKAAGNDHGNGHSIQFTDESDA